ncbi:MAG: hypothetical protein EOO41_02830 [Methanobacteriota archaeon]|nr:MAG: hypothetical protein EOO41_02830 [Euryarchaeota archaeon]
MNADISAVVRACEGGGGDTATPPIVCPFATELHVSAPCTAAQGCTDSAPFTDELLRGLPVTRSQLLRGKHPWSGARLIPMAANVQWLLIECDAPGERWHLQLLHNEGVVSFPACPGAATCPLSSVRAYYRDYAYKQLGVGMCSPADWMAHCGGIPVDICD